MSAVIDGGYWVLGVTLRRRDRSGSGDVVKLRLEAHDEVTTSTVVVNGPSQDDSALGAESPG